MSTTAAGHPGSALATSSSATSSALFFFFFVVAALVVWSAGRTLVRTRRTRRTELCLCLAAAEEAAAPDVEAAVVFARVKLGNCRGCRDRDLHDLERGACGDDRTYTFFTCDGMAMDGCFGRARVSQSALSDGLWLWFVVLTSAYASRPPVSSPTTRCAASTPLRVSSPSSSDCLSWPR